MKKLKINRIMKKILYKHTPIFLFADTDSPVNIEEIVFYEISEKEINMDVLVMMK